MMLFFNTVPTASSETFGYWADAISKITTSASIAAGGVWTIVVYRSARQKEVTSAALAAKQPFLMRRLELYSEATLCAARIAVGTDEAEIASAKRRFWDLYWGPMAIVEDPGVETAMVAFGQALNESVSPTVLETAAIRLAHSCRDSLAASWHVDLSKSGLKLGSREYSREWINRWRTQRSNV
jgi:hypothetical protein